MKLTRFALPTALLSTAAFASPLAETKFSFSVAEGASNVKTYKAVAQLGLDSIDMTINGSPPPMMPTIELTVTTKSEIVVSDDYLAMREGGPKKLKRTYDTLGSDTEMRMEMEIMGSTTTQETPMKAKSELEGKSVLFSWNADEEEFKASFPDGKDGEKLLEGLEEDMDMRAFLPSKAVAEGDEWKVEPAALASIMAPGGNLKLMPEDMGGMDSMMMNSNMGTMSDWFTDSIEGEVTAKFVGLRKSEGGAKLGAIQLVVKVSNAVDLTEMVAAAMENVDLPPEAGEMDFDHLDLEIKLSGEGMLLWNLDAGQAHSLELSGDFSMMMNMGMSMNMQGMGSMDLEQTIQMSGTITQSASVK